MRKRIAIITVLTILMASLTPAFAGEQKTEVLSTQGQIRETGENRIRVSGQGAYDEIVLRISEETHIVSGVDGRILSAEELKAGGEVTVYYGPAVSKSLPPQGNAVAIVAGKPAEGSPGKYMKAAEVEHKEDGSIRVLNSNGDMLITIRPEVLPEIASVQKDSELLVWYEVMTMSLPGQAGATKAVLLSPRTVVRVHTGAGVIAIQGRELPLDRDDMITNNGKTLLLPLRVIAEALGYEVVWQEENREITLHKGTNEFALRIDKATYYQKGAAVTLEQAPRLINGKTLVPVEFFTEIMKQKVEIHSGHI